MPSRVQIAISGMIMTAGIAAVAGAALDAWLARRRGRAEGYAEGYVDGIQRRPPDDGDGPHLHVV